MKTIYKALVCSAVVALISAGLAGCKSQKKAAGAPSEPVATADSPLAKGRSPENDFRMLTGSYKGWQSVSMPVKVRMAAPKRVSMSGTLSMEYGRALEINMRMLFINALTIYADNETVILISKPLDICYEGSIAAFTAATGLDLRDLQSLFLGQLFEPGSGTATPSSLGTFSLDGSGTGDIAAIDIRPRRNMTGVDWFFRATAPESSSGTVPELQKLDITVRNVHFECNFDDIMDTPAGAVAGELGIKGRVRTHDIDCSLISDPASARWNRSSGISKPSIPAGMRRMTTEEIFRMLKR